MPTWWRGPALNSVYHHLETIPRKAAKDDSEYQQLWQLIINGFPPHLPQLSDSCKKHWIVCNNLTINDDFIVNGCQLLIPAKLRQNILSQFHELHQDSKQRARLSVYWPGSDNNIDNVILLCKQCQDHLPSNPKEPLMQKNKPVRPFQGVVVDL